MFCDVTILIHEYLDNLLELFTFCIYCSLQLSKNNYFDKQMWHNMPIPAVFIKKKKRTLGLISFKQMALLSQIICSRLAISLKMGYVY